MTTRIIISLPVDLLKDLDIFSQENNYNRSECIRHAVRELIAKKEKKNV